MIRLRFNFSFLAVPLVLGVTSAYAHSIRLSSTIKSGVPTGSEAAIISVVGNYPEGGDIPIGGNISIEIPVKPGERGPINENFQLPDNKAPSEVLAHLGTFLGRDVPHVVQTYLDEKPRTLKISYLDSSHHTLATYGPKGVVSRYQRHEWSPKHRFCTVRIKQGLNTIEVPDISVAGLIEGQPVELEAIRLVFSPGEWDPMDSRTRVPGGSFLKCSIETKYRPVATPSTKPSATPASMDTSAMESGRVVKSSESASVASASGAGNSSSSSSASVSLSTSSSGSTGSSAKGN